MCKTDLNECELFWTFFLKVNSCSNRIGATFKPTNESKKKLWGSEREPLLCVKGADFAPRD
jgi:hypothetical protein